MLIDVNACRANVISYFLYNAKDERCAFGLLAKQNLYVRNVFGNAELEELINSQSFANSGDAPVAFR